jgi:hypothetical protein
MSYLRGAESFQVIKQFVAFYMIGIFIKMVGTNKPYIM